MNQVVQIPVQRSKTSTITTLLILDLWDRVRMSSGSMDTYLNNKILNTILSTSKYTQIDRFHMQTTKCEWNSARSSQSQTKNNTPFKAKPISSFHLQKQR